MRTLVLSDIHANLEALDAVLAAVPADRYDRVLVLGDLVGYGANPNEVVDRLFDLEPGAMIRGNHDKVASGVEPPTHFNDVAATAARWTFDVLTETNRSRVAALPVGPVQIDHHVEICHGTPSDEDVYVFSEDDARRALDAASRPVCFFGHTHVAVAYARAAGGRLEIIVPEMGLPIATVVTLRDDHRYLINPGSVGQPRDGDPRAACALYDDATSQVEMIRVAYRVDLAQERITAAGLPESLSRRLAVGR